MAMAPFRTHFWFTLENGDVISVMVQVSRLISRREATIKDNLLTTNIMVGVPSKNQISSIQDNSKTGLMMAKGP